MSALQEKKEKKKMNTEQLTFNVGTPRKNERTKEGKKEIPCNKSQCNNVIKQIVLTIF